MVREDLEHKLLSGGIIHLGNCPTYKVTLKDMADYGFTRMQNIIAFMATDDASASKFLNKDAGSADVSTFSVLMASILQELSMVPCRETADEPILYNSSITFLNLFFRQNVAFDGGVGFVISDKDGNVLFVLNEENYGQFRNILKYRNCFVDIENDYNENPANEMAAKLLEKKRILNEKLRKSKKSIGEEDISMSDLISIFAEAESMPVQDVYSNYDIYQFNNQFNRLKIMDDYHVNIRALLAGAKSEDVKLQHWISKIKKDK